MLILLIQSYDSDTKVGHRALRDMRNLFESLFHKHGELDVNFMERSYDQLGDLVVDWEHDQLHHTAEDHCLKFDHIDMIIVTGDLHTLPWEPQAMQLVTLIHMAKFADKPVLGVGFGAFAAIYSLATKGARFNVLNGPGGELIDQLATFQRYCIGTGAFPSGWLDKETGDVYTYKKADMSWHPVCNLGVHSIDLIQDSILDNEQTMPKKFTLKEDFKTVAPSQQMTVTKKSDGTVLHFTPKLLQHKFLHDIPVVKNSFNVKVFHEWRLNRDGCLPPNEHLLVLAEGKTGPLILARNRMLLLAMRYDHGPDTVNPIIVSMMSNFIGDFLLAFRNAPTGKIELSMHKFLFGETQGQEVYDTAHHRASMAPSLARRPIPTKWNLPHGPVKTDTPVMDMFFRPPKTALDFDYTVLTAKRRSSTVGKKPKVAIQNPLSARKKRLEQALISIGCLDQHKAIEKSMGETKQTDPYGLNNLLPETNRNMLAGLVMNENSITSRRHHNVEYQQYYESIFPKGPPLPLENRFVMTSSVFSNSVSSPSNPPPQTGASAGIFSMSEPSGTHIPFVNMNYQEKLRSVSPSRVHYSDEPSFSNQQDEDDDDNNIMNKPKLAVRIDNVPQELKSYSPAFLEAHRGSLFAKNASEMESWLLAGKDRQSTSADVTHKVPTIENWVQVYKISGAGNALLNTAQSSQEPPVSSVPNSARSYEAPNTARSGKSAAPPASARSSHSQQHKSHRKHRTAQNDQQAQQFSPRSAEEILSAKIQSYLPTQHPASIRVGFVEEHVIQPRSKGLNSLNSPHNASTASSFTNNTSSSDARKLLTDNNDNNNNKSLSMHGSSYSTSLSSPYNAGSVSGTPRKPSYHGRSAYRESRRMQESPKRSPKHGIQLLDSFVDSDEEEEEVEDPGRVVEGVVRIVTQSGLPPPSAIPFYHPPETNEDQEFRTNHIPSILRLTSAARSNSPAMRAQTAAKTAKMKKDIGLKAEPAASISQFRKPYNNFHRLTKKNQKQDLARAQTYEGTYIVGEYRSAEETYRLEALENKEKYIAGEFQTRFSQQNTTMTLRPEGLVRPSGPYPDPPGFALPPNTKAYDWLYMTDLHPRDELLAGQWK